MTRPAQQAAIGYRDLVTRARNEQRRLVDVERRDAYAIVRMNEPEALNPLNGRLSGGGRRSRMLQTGVPARDRRSR